MKSKYTSTFYPGFNKSIAKPLVVAVPVILGAMLFKQYIIGTVAVLVLLGILFVILRNYQIRTQITSDAIIFERSRTRLRYPWEAVAGITCSNDRVQFQLIDKSNVIFPVFDPKESRYEEMKEVLSNVCRMQNKSFQVQ